MSKIFAVPVSELNNEISPVDERFGRCHAFILFDENGNIVKSFLNENKDAAHGAGTGASALLIKNGVTDAVAGHFGPKASEVLKAANVKLWENTSARTAEEIFKKWKNNELKQA